MAEGGFHRAGGRPPLRLETLLEDFVWLRLARAPLLALAPGRWAIALMATLAISILREAFGGLSEEPDLLGRIGAGVGGPARDGGVALLTLRPQDAGGHAAAAAAGMAELLVNPPGLGVILMALPELVIWLLVGVAISRMVALDFARGESMGPAAGLRFGARGVAPALGAIGAPLLVAAGLGAIVAVFGLLAAIPVVDVVVAALGFVGVILSLAAAALVVFTIVGGALALPAIACDGADAADAIQRAWAYLISRPIQLFFGALAALALGVILIGIVGWFVQVSLVATEAWAGAWSERAGAVAGGRAEGGTAGAAAWLAMMWRQAAQAAVLALAVSYFFTAVTLIYLFVRQSCDGQDYTDIWSPGATERLIAEAMQARADAAAVPEGPDRLGARAPGNPR